MASTPSDWSRKVNTDQRPSSLGLQTANYSTERADVLQREIVPIGTKRRFEVAALTSVAGKSGRQCEHDRTEGS